MMRSRETLVALVCCLSMSATARGEQVLQSVRWQELAAAGTLHPGTAVAAAEGAEGPALRVVHEGTVRKTYHLVTIERPRIAAPRYALRGRVKYDSVAAGSYLEMWTHLPEGAFFSRTLSDSGAMRRLEGSSAWRAFVLPFSNREGGPAPEKLVVNLILTGTGTVEIGPLELVQFTSEDEVVADSAAWWSDRQAGLLGGIVGSTLGLLGALVGWMGSTGRAKRFVLGTLKTIGWMGIAAIVAGAMALGAGQPYAVYYPLLLTGAIGATLGFLLPRSVTKRYEDLELRRMQSLDT